MNNYEKIRNMSIDKVAKLLAPCEHCMYGLCENEKCEECVNDIKQMLLLECEE